MKWSGREDMELGRSFAQLVVPINMYKNRYDTIAILVSMFGGCREQQLDDSLSGWLSGVG
jgi:hypothetical protein